MDEKRLPFVEHLRELRAVLRNSAIALVVSTAICFWFAKPIFAILARPLIAAWKEAGLGEAQLNFASLTEPFWVFFEVALYAGIFLASPIIFHQIWSFVAPGLYEKERRIAIPFAIFSGLFFIGGAVFCYFFVFPAAFEFLLSYASSNLSSMSDLLGGIVEVNVADPLAVKPVLMMKNYLDLLIKMLLAFGLVFELPLLVFFLSYAGIVTHRSLWRFNKYAVILSFVVGAILTPGPDVVSQLLMAAPMIVLYNLSIIVALVVTRRREAAEAATAAE